MLRELPHRGVNLVPLPEGRVAFLFSDVEGSTRLLEQHPTLMGQALARHHELFERSVGFHRGVIFETVGDAVYAAFADPADALACALDAQLTLAREDWGEVGRMACRIAIDQGDVVRRGEHYFGPVLFRCARLQAIGYGEQVLLSSAAASAVGNRLPEGASLRDLGTHRLKDLAEPEQVAMLEHTDLRASFPPPKSLDLHPNNLPAPLTSLIGRDDLVQEVAALLDTDRLVVLTGAGGIGKTRLALATATAVVERQPHGTFFVDLAAVSDAHLVIPAIADTIGLAPQPNVDLATALAEFLIERPMLLVLDNLEQIPAVGPRLATLLEGAPELRVLATSRRPLHVRGERIVPVPPLTAGGDTTALGPGGLMFVARAAAGGFTFTDEDLPAVVRIVELVDGLPLAIELAAARTRLLGPRVLLRHLDRRLDILTGGAEDLPGRQRTLRDTIAWSHGLLTDEERRVFAALSVFEGGCTVDAALAVAETDIDTLMRLVDAALLVRRDDRLRMLETIREFAADELSRSAGDDAVSRRHADWFRDWSVAAAVGSPNQPENHEVPDDVAEIERDNIEAAVEWLLAHGDGDAALVMAMRLWAYWLSHGMAVQGERWFGRAIDLAGLGEDRASAAALAKYSEFPRFRGDIARALPIKVRAIELSRRIGADRVLAASLHDMADLLASAGDLEGAREAAAESLELRHHIGDAVGIIHALEGFADLEVRFGDPMEARRHTLAVRDHVRAAAIEQEATFGSAAFEALQAWSTELDLAIIDHHFGDDEGARRRLAAILPSSPTSAPDAMVLMFALEASAGTLARVGEADAAAQVLGAHQSYRRGLGLRAWHEAVLQEAEQTARAELGPARFAEQHAAGARLAVGEALVLAARSLASQTASSPAAPA